MTLSRLTTLALTLVFLIGCEPRPGELVDAREVSAGDLRIRLELRAEGQKHNPWQGQHFEMYCHSANVVGVGTTAPWRFIASGFFGSGGLRVAPTQRLAVHESGFVFTDIFGGAIFSFDGCSTLLQWSGKFPEKYEQMRAGRLRTESAGLGQVQRVAFCPHGLALEFLIERGVLGDSVDLWVKSSDGGETWEYLEGEMPKLACGEVTPEIIELG